ncbi:MAG: pyridoxal phosphate-dependent aminotransferase family protein [Flavobacteriales bacterium]|nr:pyridoxal phosphate-dependent aminotransferase family protein [Flavobacteriales bacterium]
MDQKLHKKLNQRREKGTLRSLSSFEGKIDFASNDYLGFSKNNLLAIKHREKGATGSRLISGNSTHIESIEQDLAQFFEAEAGLCFNSGYDANIGVMSSIPQRGDVVLFDEFVHASVRDGIRLSLAKSLSFKHNDPKDLRRLMEKHRGDVIYIVIEGLYSMHGDLCPLLEMVNLAKEFNAYIILDEAHSAGVFGKKGRGFAHGVDLHESCFIRLVTFGKAYGAHGAVVLCSADLREYLINFARSFIYTTALPVSAYERMKMAALAPEIDEYRRSLQHRIAYFQAKKSGKFQSESAVNSPIQFIRFKDISQLKKAENTLKQVGIFAKAIYAPTVPEGSEGLRISLHSFNSEEEIDALMDSLSV